MINSAVLVSGVRKRDSVIHDLYLFSKMFSHLGDYRILSRVLCAIQ